MRAQEAVEGWMFAGRPHCRALFVWLIVAIARPAACEEPTRDTVWARATPYQGESVRGVSSETLRGKILCGYQGWFTAPGDGSGRGFSHYSRNGRFEPGHCSIDLWPDVRELGEAEKFSTPFRNADGTTAMVFSSHVRPTVLRHFEWMREYGIDGAFVQRFAVETIPPRNLLHCNTVLAHCREGANRSGRAYAVMYDLSGLTSDRIPHVMDDWRQLVTRMRLTRDPNDRAYLRENGKPVVALWGVGFNDGRKYTLADCERLIRFFKQDPEYGGCTVMLGVPTGWRTLDRDSVADAELHRVLRLADLLSPWTVGRYATPNDVARHADRCWKPDLVWCRKQNMRYLPVVFPGFSWHNMKPEFPLDQIPRRNGQFLWSQFVQARKAGAEMIYVAMFDELDEGTAIFKCSNNPPVGASRFVVSPDLPTDHYLWLTGMGGRLLRGEIEATEEMPKR